MFGEDDNTVIHGAIQRVINSVSEASDRIISPRHVQQHSQPEFHMLRYLTGGSEFQNVAQLSEMATNIMFALVPPIVRPTCI